MKKIGVVSLGCPKNLVDSEIMLGLLNKSDFEIVSEQTEADIIIVNTCGFIETARQESVNTILEMAQCKKDRCKLLIVTGCLAERYRHDILEEIPEVDAVIGTGSYSEIVGTIEKAFKGEKPEVYGDLTNTIYLETDRIVSTGKSYAYLKLAEGCDNCCTYCIIPSLRGRFRSRHMEDVISEARKLVESGVKELILIAQDTTRYGMDMYKERSLVLMIQKLSEIKGLVWIRLLYCYPEEIDDALIEEIAKNEKVCKYLDIPIQHASDNILKKMGRRGSSDELQNLLGKIRKRIPDMIIRTSLIVGFPGETEEDFEILKNFIVKYRFDRLGVFMYSREEGTPAAKFKPQVLKSIKKQRYNTLMKLQQEISMEKNLERLEKEYKVLIEGIADDGIFYYGRSTCEAPDIDGLIYFTSYKPEQIGEIVTVKILQAGKYDLTGEVKNESTE